MKLLDTTFLIHYWGGDDATKTYLTRHEDSETFITSTISLKELAVGRHRQDRFDRQELETTFGWLEVVPFTPEAAYEAAALEADLWETATRRQVEARGGDVLIAGVARALDAPVVTRNTDDFEAFDDVETEAY